MLDTERAWLAGLFDGEGHIGIDKVNHDSGVESYNLRLSLSMTCEDTVARVHELLPGNRCVQAPRGNRQPLHQWQARKAVDVKYALDMIEPYVVTKVRQVFLAQLIVPYKLRGQHGVRETSEAYLHACQLLANSNSAKGNRSVRA